MFGNLTGTYPGIQVAFYEPELGQKQPNLGTLTVGPEFDPGLRQPVCRERIDFNEVETQIHSRKTRRGRITKLASVLGNPHSECAENASILMRSKRKSPPSASQGKS